MYDPGQVLVTPPPIRSKPAPPPLRTIPYSDGYYRVVRATEWLLYVIIGLLCVLLVIACGKLLLLTPPLRMAPPTTQPMHIAPPPVVRKKPLT